jgi:hypothetical protein
MAKFALGKNALGISDRSGFQYPLHQMRKEWNGLLVGFDEWEAKHPQLTPRRRPTDPQALRDPRPDRVEPLVVFVGVPLVEAPNLRPLQTFGLVGQVTVVIT